MQKKLTLVSGMDLMGHGQLKLFRKIHDLFTKYTHRSFLVFSRRIFFHFATVSELVFLAVFKQFVGLTAAFFYLYLSSGNLFLWATI